MKKVEILNADEKVIATFTTKSTRLRDAVYKYKKLNGIDEATTWREAGTVEPEKLDPRIPSFDDLKENTRRTYRQHLKNFFKQGGDHKSYDSIKAYYDKIPSTSKQAFLYATMLMNPKDETFKKKLKGLVRDSFDEVRQIRADRPKNEGIPLKDLQKKAKEYKTDNPVNRFIADWYAFSGLPFRADTLVHITKKKDKKSKKDLNVVYTRDKKILMNKFKTVSSHGSKTIPLTYTQTQMLVKGLKASGGNMLLNLTADTLLHRVREIFGVGVNQFRHSWITHNYKKMKPDQFKTYCWNLNTSVQMGLDTYNDE